MIMFSYGPNREPVTIKPLSTQKPSLPEAARTKKGCCSKIALPV